MDSETRPHAPPALSGGRSSALGCQTLPVYFTLGVAPLVPRLDKAWTKLHSRGRSRPSAAADRGRLLPFSLGNANTPDGRETRLRGLVPCPQPRDRGGRRGEGLPRQSVWAVQDSADGGNAGTGRRLCGLSGVSSGRICSLGSTASGRIPSKGSGCRPLPQSGRVRGGQMGRRSNFMAENDGFTSVRPNKGHSPGTIWGSFHLLSEVPSFDPKLSIYNLNPV